MSENKYHLLSKIFYFVYIALIGVPTIDLDKVLAEEFKRLK